MQTKKQIEKKIGFLANGLNTVGLIFKECQSEIEIRALTGQLVSTKAEIMKEQNRLDREQRRKLEEAALLEENKW